MTKTKPEPEPTPEKPVFTLSEVSAVEELLQSIYALDDAVANQLALKRPETFVQPLRNIRENVNNALARLFAKAHQQTVAEKASEPSDADPAT